jgi:uncharacterized membrane protein YdjX (TVP38/TMEM64 family)
MMPTMSDSPILPDSNVPEAQDVRKETGRLIIGALLITSMIVLLHFTPLRQWIDDAQAMKQSVQALGWLGILGYIVASIALIALGVPRLALCGLGGLFFGFTTGVIAAQFAGVIGAYVAFLATRWWAPKAWVQSQLGRSKRLSEVLANPSIGSIFVARQLPVPGLLPNVLLGVLHTRHSVFLIGTFLGYLPSNIPVALAGSSLGKATLIQAFQQNFMSVLALLGFGVAIMVIRRRLQQKH